MSKDIENSIKKAEEAMANLDKMAKQSLDDANQKIKKGMIQTAIWVLVTIIIYFIWGATWFFWLSFAFNVISVAGLVFAKVMIAKTHAKMARSHNTYTFDKDEEYEDEELVYDEKQKVLERLLNDLSKVSETDGEVYDTECREQMNEAVVNAFIFEKADYVMPDNFGLYKKEGNEAVKKALESYVNSMLPLAQGHTVEERLAMFQDDVFSEEGESPDEFFGWIEVEDLKHFS